MNEIIIEILKLFIVGLSGGGLGALLSIKLRKNIAKQEHLKNAIEHLGHGSESVRMGGAHEIFHLAKDNIDLRQIVIDILCTHIRQTTRGKDYQAEYKAEPSEEIQSLLSLLFVQDQAVLEGCTINLRGSYLRGAILDKSYLKNANLIGVNLQDAYLHEAQLQKANLWKAQMQYARIIRAQMQGAYLEDAQMQSVSLMFTQLQGTNLNNAKLQTAILSCAEFQGAILMGANMQGAILVNTNLQGAILTSSRMQGAHLNKTQMQGVDSTECVPAGDFESRIRSGIDDYDGLLGIYFSGGITKEEVDASCAGVIGSNVDSLRKELSSHVGHAKSDELGFELQSEGRIIKGAYKQEEAEEWIAEYNKATQEKS